MGLEVTSKGRQRIKFLWTERALIDAWRVAGPMAQQASSMGERISTVRTGVSGCGLPDSVSVSRVGGGVRVADAPLPVTVHPREATTEASFIALITWGA
jgi:hypothetical protein